LVFEILHKYTSMPYTKEEIEDKLRKALDASYVVRLFMRYLSLIAFAHVGCGNMGFFERIVLASDRRSDSK